MITENTSPEDLTIQALLRGIMITLASQNRETAFLIQRATMNSFFDLDKDQQKKVRTACKEAIDKMKNNCNYNLFAEYNPIVLDDLNG